MPNPFMKWGDFVTAVKRVLAADATRIGAEDFVDDQIRFAAADLQANVPEYRMGHETIYGPSDFALDGKASRGTLPPLARLQDVYLVKDEQTRTQRFPVTEFPWERRFELTSGLANVTDQNGRMAVDLQAYTFYIYPAVESPFVLSVNWDGMKVDFRDDEQTPFELLAVEAAAERVKAKIVKHIEEDTPRSTSHMQDYLLARRRCLLEMKKRGFVR